MGELKMQDAWLCFCGGSPESSDGKSDILHNMPSLIQNLTKELGDDFRAINHLVNAGGLHLIQKVKNKLMGVLKDKKLSKAEQLFTLVAMLRAAKAGMYIILRQTRWRSMTRFILI